MKKILLLALVSTNLMATERLLLSDSKFTDIELTESSVRCSDKGYGTGELKINIKSLDGWTIFDHSNIKAGDLLGEPCMTAGICKRSENDKTGLTIGDILSSGNRTENIKINRQLVEVKEIGKDESGSDVCFRHVQERLQTAVVRGDGAGKIKFTHVRYGIEETFPLSVCQRK